MVVSAKTQKVKVPKKLINKPSLPLPGFCTSGFGPGGELREGGDVQGRPVGEGAADEAEPPLALGDDVELLPAEAARACLGLSSIDR